MCICKEEKGAPLWGTTCKCSHAEVAQISERFVNNAIERSWVCKQPGCDRAWVKTLKFDSQDQLEGRI